MVERGLRAAGHRTGRYTSPHLFAIEERISIDGVALASTAFDGLTEHVLARVDHLITSGALLHLPTFFEVTTAIAFEAFKRAQVSAAVIEVGLGGRFDATNVIAPHVTAITSIALDHEKQLGTTLEQIAFEKAGIIKPRTPVVLGAMAGEAHAVILDIARGQDAPVIDAQLATSGEPVTLALNGQHQQINAAVAIDVLRRCTFAGSPAPSRDALKAALTDVEWPARLEWLQVPGYGMVLIDAAHNPEGARALASYVRDNLDPLPLVLAVMRDKDVDRIVAALAPAASRVIATSVPSARAMPSGELAARVRTAAPAIPCTADDDAEGALLRACREHGRALAAGSIFLVGPLRTRLLSRGATPVRYPSKASPFYLN
jgi:dihydrofolate synthase/folylpolyglutamate synthase